MNTRTSVARKMMRTTARMRWLKGDLWKESVMVAVKPACMWAQGMGERRQKPE
jgi:hypothetical protein